MCRMRCVFEGYSEAKLEDGDAESGDLPSAGCIDDTHGRPLGGYKRADPLARHSRNQGPRSPNPRLDTKLRSCAARLQSWWETTMEEPVVVGGWPCRSSVGTPGIWLHPFPSVALSAVESQPSAVSRPSEPISIWTL